MVGLSVLLTNNRFDQSDKTQEHTMKYYAGIGPRKTPADVQSVMTDIARQLVPTGWCLRSGHAEGADQAFERGATNRQIFLPWEGFNNGYSNGRNMAFMEPSPIQWGLAQKYHPAWDRCSPAAQRLLARNVPIILGEFFEDPVTCVITWLPTPTYQGGTRHALNIADDYKIPVFDLNIREDQIELCKFILNVENRAPAKQMETA